MRQRCTRITDALASA